MNGKIDIALTLDFDLIDYPTDDIIYQVFFESAPKCVISKAHPLAKPDEIHFDSLSTETMIAIDPAISKGAYNNIVQFCERHGFTPSNTIYASSIQNILLKVEAGLGFSVLDENCISNSQYCGAVIAILQDRSTASRRCLEKKQPKSGHSAVQ